ncbi:MAG: mechanosensitive ion channel [Gammaproteobacteria bacterium]|nr:mechanosensitive ion channel [Gammaproteobacteria bacterium]
MRLALNDKQHLTRRFNFKHFIAFTMLVALWLSSFQLIAQEFDTRALASTLEKIDQELSRKSDDIDYLTDLSEQVADIKGQAKLHIVLLQPQLDKTNQVLESLGDYSKDEPIEVREKRNEIKKKRTEVKRKLASSQVLVLQSDELLNKLQEKTTQQLALQLLARGENIIVLLQENWHEPLVWLNTTRVFLHRHSGLDLISTTHWAILILALFILIGGGIVLRRVLTEKISARDWSDDFASMFMHSLVATPSYYAPHLFGSIGAAGLFYYMTRGIDPVPFISIVAYGLPPYFLFVVMVDLLLSPPRPATTYLDIPEKLSRQLARRLQFLAMLTFLGYLLFSTLLSQSLPQPAILITRAIVFALLIMNLIWAISLVMRFPRIAKMRWLTASVYLLLIASLIIEWMGYRNLSLVLLKDVLGSLLAFGLMLFTARLFHELYDSLDTGTSHWAFKARNVLGIQHDESVPGLSAFRLITTLILWLLFAYVLLMVWDVSETIILDIHTKLTQGFEVGSLLIIPSKLAGAIVTTMLIIVFGGWIRKRLELSWLNKSRMERGTKEAVVTISGYVIVASAFIIGLGVAGFDFGSLAIIAGALSVGIGFGLQNVVNNFISGLILLFERPVKTGDWIIVGGTEGYVKRIRIRSTQIETFDRADVIVPNSELISAQVTNWMLRNQSGRIRVPVGVAYGSDTGLVKKILEDIASEHPKVITSGVSPVPKVLFIGFGESSLDFELRCHIMNIDERMMVASDINFAIDAAFREHNIEIPFPQRDVYVRELPVLQDKKSL